MGTIVGLNKLFNRKCNNSVSVHLSLYWYNDYKLHTYISTAIYISQWAHYESIYYQGMKLHMNS